MTQLVDTLTLFWDLYKELSSLLVEANRRVNAFQYENDFAAYDLIKINITHGWSFRIEQWLCIANLNSNFQLREI